MDSGNYRLYCGCNRQKEMKIDKDFKRIYPASNSVNHREGCPRNKKYIYNKGVYINKETGETSITIDFSLNPNKFKQNLNDNSNKNNELNNKKIYLNNTQTDGKLTVSALIKNLNTFTWKKKAEKGILFSDKFDFWRTFCYKESYLVTLNCAAIVDGKKTSNLREMLFEPYKYKQMNHKESRFAYMYFSELKDLNNGNFELICKYQNSNKSISEFRFIVTYDKLYEALENSNLNISSLNKGDFIVGGFVFKNKFHRIEFFELSIIRCSEYGLFAESSYEAEFYTMLSNNNKLFYKPNETIPGYKNYIPDGILIEPNIFKKIVIEIFGVNSQEYREERDKKICLINTDLKDSHHLVYWDALDNKPMPTIDYINSILNNLA